MRKSRKRMRTNKLRYLLPLLVFLPVFFFLNFRLLSAREGLARYSDKDLLAYTGDDFTKPVYLALNGYVYDVSSGRSDFYDPGKPYHYLTGRDASSELNMFGGSIIKRKYKIVGIYKP
jgi:predicted heme/steroid binding protein